MFKNKSLKTKVIAHGAHKPPTTFPTELQNSIKCISSSCDILNYIGICNMITNGKDLIDSLRLSSIESFLSELIGTVFI